LQQFKDYQQLKRSEQISSQISKQTKALLSGQMAHEDQGAQKSLPRKETSNFPLLSSPEKKKEQEE